MVDIGRILIYYGQLKMGNSLALDIRKFYCNQHNYWLMSDFENYA